MTRLLLLFCTIIFFASCGDGTPNDVIGKEEMTSLLTDLHLADGYTSTLYGGDKAKEIAATYKAIYKKYNTDSLQVRKSLSFYTANPQVLQLMYVQIDTNLNRALKQEQKLATEREEIELKRQNALDALLLIKEKFKADSLNRLNGTYDFALPDYFTSIKDYLNTYEMPAALIKADSTRIDSIKRNSLRIDSLRRDSLKRDSIKRSSKKDTVRKKFVKKQMLMRQKIK